MEKSKFDQAMSKLIDMFATDQFPEQLAFTIIKKDKADSKPSDNWSLLNRIIQLVIGETTDARTYKQWQAVNRQVRKGEKSFCIIAPNTVKKKKDDGVEEVVVIGYHPLPVFAIEQTEGEALPIFDYTPLQVPLDTEILTKALSKLGCRVKYDAMRHSVLGYYRIGQKEIVLSSPDFAVLAHEASHYVHDTIDDINKIDVAKAEVVAELSAAVICAIAGVTGYERQSRDYIKHYAAGCDFKELLKTMNSVLKLTEIIVTTLIDAMENITIQSK